MGIPSTIGALALGVFVWRDLVMAYWGQAAAFYVQMAIGAAILWTTNWERCATEVKKLQEVDLQQESSDHPAIDADKAEDLCDAVACV